MIFDANLLFSNEQAVTAAAASSNVTTVPYERFLRLKYTPNNGDLSAGKITAGLVLDVPNWEAFPSAVSTGVE